MIVIIVLIVIITMIVIKNPGSGLDGVEALGLWIASPLQHFKLLCPLGVCVNRVSQYRAIFL